MFLNNFQPSPILIDLGPFQIYWYGFLISLSVLIGFFIARQLFKKYKLPLDSLYDLIFYLIIFSVLGARLWDIFYLPDYYLSNPIQILKIWQGGLAIHGVIIAGTLTIYLYSKIKKFNFLQLLDIFAPLVALGQGIGRWGNYFNQELYGQPTDSPLGIFISLPNRLPGYKAFEFFHPVFLYESLWCLLLFSFLIYLHHLRLKLTPKYLGSIFLTYLTLYSLGRFFIGFLRIDPMTAWLNLRLDQWLSLILIIISIIFFIIFKKYSKQARA